MHELLPSQFRGGITRTINVSQTAARLTVTEVQYNFDSFAGTSNGWISAQGTIEARFSNQFITSEFRLRKAVYEGDTLISEDFSKSGNNKITVVPTNTSYYDVTILSEYGGTSSVYEEIWCSIFSFVLLRYYGSVYGSRWHSDSLVSFI